MTFICDYDIGRTVGETLRTLGKDECETFMATFPQNTPDDVWLPIIGHRGWFVISKDDKQRRETGRTSRARSPQERLLYARRHGGTIEVMLTILLKHWTFMEQRCLAEERPFVYALYRS